MARSVFWYGVFARESGAMRKFSRFSAASPSNHPCISPGTSSRRLSPRSIKNMAGRFRQYTRYRGVRRSASDFLMIHKTAGGRVRSLSRRGGTRVCPCFPGSIMTHGYLQGRSLGREPLVTPCSKHRDKSGLWLRRYRLRFTQFANTAHDHLTDFTEAFLVHAIDPVAAQVNRLAETHARPMAAEKGSTNA